MKNGRFFESVKFKYSTIPLMWLPQDQTGVRSLDITNEDLTSSGKFLLPSENV
jgi:hypothetical protein